MALQETAAGLKSLTDVTGALIGSSTSGRSKSATSGTSETQTSKKLVLEQDAIDKIIADVLGGADGLASLFSAEQASGIFDSSVAAQAAGDLVSKLVGEIAKLTGEEVSTESVQETGTVSSKTTGDSPGQLQELVGGVGSIVKDVGKIFGF